MKIAEIFAVVSGLFLGIIALSAGQGLVGSILLVMTVFLLFFGQERNSPVYLRPWVKKYFRIRTVDPVNQSPDSHTAQQTDVAPEMIQPMKKALPAEEKTVLSEEPVLQKNSVSHTLSYSVKPIEYKENDVTFQLKPDGTAEVIHCCGWRSRIELPETVAGYRVTSIGANAFPKGSCSSLSIPTTVTNIQSLPKSFTEQVWDRPRFDMRENAMDIDEPVLVERTHSVYIYVEPGSYAEQYCQENNIRYVVK